MRLAATWGADVIPDPAVTGPVWVGLHEQVPVVATNYGPFDTDLAAIYRRPRSSMPRRRPPSSPSLYERIFGRM